MDFFREKSSKRKSNGVSPIFYSLVYELHHFSSKTTIFIAWFTSCAHFLIYKFYHHPKGSPAFCVNGGWLTSRVILFPFLFWLRRLRTILQQESEHLKTQPVFSSFLAKTDVAKKQNPITTCFCFQLFVFVRDSKPNPMNEPKKERKSSFQQKTAKKKVGIWDIWFLYVFFFSALNLQPFQPKLLSKDLEMLRFVQGPRPLTRHWKDRHLMGSRMLDMRISYLSYPDINPDVSGK